MFRIAEERKRREIDPLMSMLKRCAVEAEEAADLDPEVKSRIAGMLSFVRLMNGWYEQMTKLPPRVLRRGVRLGGKIADLIGT